ncbi:MAG: PQQ-dependent sugar dehydrogenase [Candidatus Kapabacteria bacterium]|nr:PQQ-dependent sugar dehydrogenase [Candidatus Kapabacteria bacterium]
MRRVRTSSYHIRRDDLLRLTSLIALSILVCAASNVGAQELFTYNRIVEGLAIPWEIDLDDDGKFWVTERSGIFSRLDPVTGEKKVLLDLRDSVELTIENGMLGFVMHPQFPAEPYVYVGYVLKGDTASKRVIARFTFRNDSLVEPLRLVEIDTAGYIHQGSRMMISNDNKLFVTMGDGDWPEKAQDPTSLRGKLLRFNLDGSIPEDNPIPGSPIWSLGHRNQQGVTMLPDGRIFTAEHGSVIEDEVNEIFKGGNYGWPFSEGPCDTPDERDSCRKYSSIEPVWSTGEVTYGVSELVFYNHDLYPVLQNSLLLVSLKQSTLFQLKFDSARTKIVETIPILPFAAGRLRAILVTKSGRIFLTTTNQDQGKYEPFPLEGDDAIIELVPVAEGAQPKYRALQDTVAMNGMVGEMSFGRFPIANDGDAPLTIENVWYDGWTNNFFNAQWRLPLVVLPKSSIDVMTGFLPTELGSFEDRLRIKVKGIDEPFVYVIYGTAVASSVAEQSGSSFELYPNPFTDAVTFRASEPSRISVAITDVLGRTVWRGSAEDAASVVWDGRVFGAGSCPPGSYHAVVTINCMTIGTLLLRR